MNCGWRFLYKADLFHVETLTQTLKVIVLYWDSVGVKCQLSLVFPCGIFVLGKDSLIQCCCFFGKVQD